MIEMWNNKFSEESLEWQKKKKKKDCFRAVGHEQHVL